MRVAVSGTGSADGRNAAAATSDQGALIRVVIAAIWEKIVDIWGSISRLAGGGSGERCGRTVVALMWSAGHNPKLVNREFSAPVGGKTRRDGRP